MAKVAPNISREMSPNAPRTPPDQAERDVAIGNFDAHICVEAGAGSGKTRVLVDRFIALLNARVPLNEIVAITFTEKAAAEMRERVRSACSTCAQSARHDPDATTFWRGIERQITGARISTIHAFCGSLLREHALALGIDPDFAILTDAEARLLQRDVAESTLESLLETGDAQAQLLAVACGVDRTVSGLVRLLQQRHDVARTAPLFRYDDAEQLRADWARAVREEYARQMRMFAQSPDLTKYIAKLEEFDGDCSEKSDGREYLRCVMLDALTAMRDERFVDAQRFIETIDGVKLNRKPHTASSKRWPSPARYQEIKNVQDEVKECLLRFLLPRTAEDDEKDAAALTSACYRVFEETASSYAEAKRARAAYDFDDLLVKTRRALGAHDRIRAATAGSIRHLLIDELQDTDPVQYEIASLLMRTEKRAGPTLFIVGDPKQAIYDFRGADIAVYAQAKAESERPLQLTTNFRSLPGVLAFPNDFFAQSGAMQAEHVRFVPLRPYRQGGDGPQVEFLSPAFEEPPSADEGRRAEAEVIAWRLQELIEGEERARVHDGDATRPAAYGDVAILFRANSDMHIYEEALRKRDIPFNVVAGKGFFERQEIHDFRNLLSAVADPWNEFTLLGFLRSPVAAMSDDAIYELTDRAGLARGFHGKFTLKDDEQNERLDAARDLVARLQARTRDPLPVFLEHALGESALEAIVLSQHHGVQKAGNLRKLLDLAEEFSRTAPPTLARFLRYLEEVAAEDLREGDAPLIEGGAGAVTLMNVHQAKGLEFPMVVVADCGRGVRDSGNFDALRVHRRLGLSVRLAGDDGETVTTAIGAAIKAAEREQGDAEHQRIFYVALTRARDRLLIGGCKLQSCSGSWFETLSKTYSLEECDHGDLFDGHGWSAWMWRRAADDAKRRRGDAKAAEAIDWARHIRRMDAIDPTAQTPQIISVTALLARMSGDAERPSPYGAASRERALRRGELVHRLFEVWDFAGDAPDVETFLAEDDRALAHDAELRTGLKGIVEAFKHSALYQAMRAHGPVEREAPFLLPLAGVMITGTVDALLADHTVVDYKTGKRNDKQLRQYSWQLQLYAWAIETLTGRAPARAVLYFVDEAHEHEVDVTPIAVADTYARAEATLRGK